MHDLPQGVTFFSAVDIDRYLRKEVDMPCITPSQLVPLPKGESLDIDSLLKVTRGDLGIAQDEQALGPVTLTHVTSPPDLGDGLHEMYLRAQAGKDAKADYEDDCYNHSCRHLSNSTHQPVRRC
jgi:DNA polymerase gamma 1